MFFSLSSLCFREHASSHHNTALQARVAALNHQNTELLRVEETLRDEHESLMCDFQVSTNRLEQKLAARDQEIHDLSSKLLDGNLFSCFFGIPFVTSSLFLLCFS